MATSDYGFHRPASLREAAELVLRLGPGAVLFAGGTEVLPDIRRGREAPAELIALDGVPALAGIEERGEQLRIGAMTTVAEVAASRLVRRMLPALSEAAAVIGGPAIRTQATIGGNFCRAVPCADTPPVGIAAEASLLVFGPAGERAVPAEGFVLGPRRTVLQPGEILVAVVIPPQPPSSGVSYARFALRRGAALAVAAVAARIVLDGDRIAEARVVLNAVAPAPLLARECAGMLRGQAPRTESFAAAAGRAAAEAQPISDIRGSAAFRRQLVEVLARRALAEATARARGARA